MLIAQIGVALGLLNLAHSDPAANLTAVVFGALFVAFASATQDIAALDAWRIESAPRRPPGRDGSRLSAGVSHRNCDGDCGCVLACGRPRMVRYLHDDGGTDGDRHGDDPAGSRAGGLRPPESQRREQRVVEWLERNAHWPAPLRNAGARFIDAVVCPLVDFFARYGSRLGILILVFICTYRLTDFAMGVMSNPFYLDAGFTLKEIAAVVKGPGLLMSILECYWGAPWSRGSGPHVHWCSGAC